MPARLIQCAFCMLILSACRIVASEFQSNNSNTSTYDGWQESTARRLLYTPNEEAVTKNQNIINSAIMGALSVVLNLSSVPAQQYMEQESIAGICAKNFEHRLGCCEPTDTRYLYDVRIASGKFIMHKESSHSRKLRAHTATSIPDIVSVQTRVKSTYKVEVVQQMGPFRDSACKSYFNGTLHVNGRVTAHNVYHAIADNLVPLAHQIMLDHILHPDMLLLPRMGLAGFPGHDAKDSMPHLQIASDIMSGGMHSMADLEGHCFRRVVWGYGAHLMYSDSLVTMRRLVSEFLRQFVSLRYELHVPREYHKSPAPVAKEPEKKFSGLNMVLYTRGSTGMGRSMRNEDGLVKALKGQGANVVICCAFNKASMTEQISYSYHADVIIGVHGAALIHGLFLPRGGIIVELKTLYAFQSAVFQLVADSRVGMVGQIDVREYWKPGGHHPIDDRIIDRTANILSLALSMKENSEFIGNYKCLTVHTKGPDPIIDCVIGSIQVNESTPELNHPLGPLVIEAPQVCHSTVLYQFRNLVYKKSADEVHCNFCTIFTLNS